MHAVYYAMENVLGKNDMRPIVIILYRRKWLMVTDNNSMRASGECIQVYTLRGLKFLAGQIKPVLDIRISTQWKATCTQGIIKLTVQGLLIL